MREKRLDKGPVSIYQSHKIDRDREVWFRLPGEPASTPSSAIRPFVGAPFSGVGARLSDEDEPTSIPVR